MKENKPIVLFLCSYQSLYGGNFVPSLLAIEQAVNRQGGKCIYAFPTGAATCSWFIQLQQMGKTVCTFDFKVSRRKQLEQLSALVRQYRPTVIHSHFAPVVPLELFAFLHKDIRVIIHIHSDWSLGKQNLKTKLKNWLIYKVLSGRVRFISVSKAFVNFNPKRINWLHNALAVKRMPCTHISGEEIRKQYGISREEILCELFGWSPQVKGVDVAVEALKQLNEQGKNYKLAIICGREITTEKMPAWIKAHTSCNGTEKFLFYLPPIEDVFAYHEAADILLSASRSEGFPYSILEMLSLGRPCVISDIPGVRWAKKYPQTFVFTSENIVDCKQAIKQAVCEKNNETSKETVQQIRADYDIDSWSNKIIREYNC